MHCTLTSSLWMKGIAIQAMDWLNTTSVGPPSIFGSFLSAENILAIVDFFPAEPELMKLAADRQADNTKVPTKAQFKASAEAQHTAATQNYVMMTTTLSDRVWPKQESEDPVSIFHNLQMSPKLWARVMGIILFTHSGNDCSIILKRAISIATGDNVWSKHNRQIRLLLTYISLFL